MRHTLRILLAEKLYDDLYKTNTYDTDPLASHWPFRWLFPISKDDISKRFSTASHQPMRDDLHKTNTYDTDDPSASHRPIRWLFPMSKDPESILLPILILHFLLRSFLISQTTCPYLAISNYLIYPEKAAHSLNIFHLFSTSILPSFKIFPSHILSNILYVPRSMSNQS